MTLEDYGNLGELIAAIATVATLVYLALQIRQNAKSVRGSVAQGVIESEIATAALIAQHPGIYGRGNSNPTELNDEEQIVYEQIVFIEITQTWNAFAQYKDGLMNKTVFAAFQVAWANSMQVPGFRSYWAKIREEFPQDFCQYVDGISTTKKSASSAGESIRE